MALLLSFDAECIGSWVNKLACKNKWIFRDHGRLTKYWNKLEWCTILNHIKIVRSLHSEIPILIALLWFNIVHYSSLFQYFLLIYESTMVPTLVVIVYNILLPFNIIDCWASKGAMCPEKWSIRYTYFQPFFTVVQIKNYCCQQRWMGHKGCNAVHQKTPIRLKWCWTVKNNQVRSLSHACMKESVSRSLSQLVGNSVQKIEEKKSVATSESSDLPAPLLSGIIEAGFWWCYFFGHAYSFVIPTMYRGVPLMWFMMDVSMYLGPVIKEWAVLVFFHNSYKSHFWLY